MPFVSSLEMGMEKWAERWDCYDFFIIYQGNIVHCKLCMSHFVQVHLFNAHEDAETE